MTSLIESKVSTTMADTLLPDWACLPRDLLDLIVDRLVEFPDFIRFGSVCKPWRSIAHHEFHSHHLLLLKLLKTCRNTLPMLLTSSSPDNHQRSLYSITEKTTYQIQMPINCDRRFCGSSQGWLLMVDKPMTINLINPFLNKTLVLPNFPGEEWDSQHLSNESAQDEFHEVEFHSDGDEYVDIIDDLEEELDNYDYHIKKAILLPQTQEGENFEVLVIYGEYGKLAYLKSRDEPWNPITISPELKVTVFADIIFYKGQVYAVSFSSALVRVDVKTGTSEIIIGDSNVAAENIYLVESQHGNLLLVRRFLHDSRFGPKSFHHMTEKFEIYRLSSEQGGHHSWVKVKRIGKQALFLGASYSMSISTLNFPQCKSNSIYYLDDCHAYIKRVDDDSGIFNIKNKRFSRHYTQNPSFCPSLPPIWIVPKLNEVKCNVVNSESTKVD